MKSYTIMKNIELLQDLISNGGFTNSFAGLWFK